MTFQNIYRVLAVLLAVNCLFSTNEVGSPTEGLTKGPLAEATRVYSDAPMAFAPDQIKDIPRDEMLLALAPQSERFASAAPIAD